jgi:hypothetical protein
MPKPPFAFRILERRPDVPAIHWEAFGASYDEDDFRLLYIRKLGIQYTGFRWILSNKE